MADDSLLDNGVLMDVFAAALSTEGNASVRMRRLLNLTLQQVTPEAKVLRIATYDRGVGFSTLGKLDVLSKAAGGGAVWSDHTPKMRGTLAPIVDAVYERLDRSEAGVTTYQLSELKGADWFSESPFYREFMAPFGFEDTWATTRQLAGSRASALVLPLNGDGGTLSQTQRASLSTVFGVVVEVFHQESVRLEQTVEALRGHHDLSNPQSQVLGCALSGLTEKQIATRLDRSCHTVNSHLREIYRRTQVTSRAELLAAVYDKQLVPRTLETPAELSLQPPDRDRIRGTRAGEKQAGLIATPGPSLR